MPTFDREYKKTLNYLSEGAFSKHFEKRFAMYPSDEELKMFARFPSLREFDKYSKSYKIRALKKIIDLPDEIWENLDTKLRKIFLTNGVNLTPSQVSSLQQDEINLYKKSRSSIFHRLVFNKMLKVNKFDSDEDVLQHQNSELALQLARNKYEMNNVPLEVLKTVATNPDTAYEFTTITERDTPSIILQALNDEQAVKVATIYYGWKNLPKILYDKVKNSGRGVPDRATIQESTHFDKYYQKIMSSFF